MPIREALCAYCHQPFTFYHAPSTNPQRYCSVRCRGRALSKSRQGWKEAPVRTGAFRPASTTLLQPATTTAVTAED